MFNLAGLRPIAAEPLPAIAHWFGFRDTWVNELFEAVTLVPGEQLRGGMNLLAVTRIMAGLAASLAKLPQIKAIVWHPARTAMAPDAFATAVSNWVQGGAFPALGLTALYRDEEGAICTEGLAFFIGQELRIQPAPDKSTGQDAKLAVRLINHLVGNNTLKIPFEMIGSDGEYLSVKSPGSDGFLRVCRKS